MKNIFLIPTDKLSKIVLRDADSKLVLHTPITQWHGQSQHIYITDNSKIKESDWYFFNVGYATGIKKADKRDIEQIHLEIEPKKVILTTDDQLIKDGVQEISEDFLQWFVKNSNCEYVKTDLVPVNEFGSEITVGWYGFDKFKYKIILPKEEPKQDLDCPYDFTSRCTMGRCDCKPKQEPNFYEKLKDYFENTPREKVLEDWNKSAEFDNVSIGEIVEEEPKLTNTINKDELGIPKGSLIGLVGVNKQETLEETKLRQLFKNRSNCYADSEDVIQAMDENCFIETINEWQQEQDKNKKLYSEEDMKKCWDACLDFNKPAGFDNGIPFNEFLKNLKINNK
jgi:hypothetical protein